MLYTMYEVQAYKTH